MKTMRLPSVRCQFIHRICRDLRNAALQNLKRITDGLIGAEGKLIECPAGSAASLWVSARSSGARRPVGKPMRPGNQLTANLSPWMHVPCMPLRLQRPVSPNLNEKVLRSYTEEAARLRDLAAHVTTARLKARLLEEAGNQERLAKEAKRGALQPHPRPVGQMHL